MKKNTNINKTGFQPGYNFKNMITQDQLKELLEREDALRRYL